MVQDCSGQVASDKLAILVAIFAQILSCKVEVLIDFLVVVILGHSGRVYS